MMDSLEIISDLDFLSMNRDTSYRIMSRERQISGKRHLVEGIFNRHHFIILGSIYKMSANTHISMLFENWEIKLSFLIYNNGLLSHCGC